MEQDRRSLRSDGKTFGSLAHRRAEATDQDGGDAARQDGPRREEILNSRETCELLRIGRTKLWQLTRECVIPAYRVGSGKRASLRYKRSELIAWLDGNRI